jgi:amino acid adenylation domain-containing protein
MLGERPLHATLSDSVARHADKIAVIDPGRATITYRELDRLSDRLRDRLVAMGVVPGDRVGIYMHKSIDALVSIFGILKAGAAYVPVDPEAPAPRCAYIFADCGVRAVIAERTLAGPLRGELARAGATPRLLLLDRDSEPLPMAALLDDEDRRVAAPEATTVAARPESLAYILYTSGSTGKPKGVMLSHRAATSFVDWCTTTFEPNESDRFSSHAPLHFDLSILDLYVSLGNAATLVLIGEQLGKDPGKLASAIAEQRITVWYSTPSILNLLAQYGKLDRHDLSAVRLVLFAGEVFPVPQLRALKALLPAPRYFNLYGPTETNVCTYFELPRDVEADRTEPYPIGQTCEHLAGRVVDLDDRDVVAGDEGELVIAGPGVMAGYWNLPEQNQRAFLVDGDGRRWYRTGDLVVEQDDGVYLFHGRRDRMVKRRGYRVELGEIEAGLATHPAAREVAVVADTGADAAVRITAFLSVSEHRPSVIELKQFCVDHLPRYMVPDAFQFVDALPRTSTDKIDYQTLKTIA